MTIVLPTVPASDEGLLHLLRDGDEGAYVKLVQRYHPAMLHVARAYVPTWAVAEEVVQDTWLGVLQGLKRFEGRSSVKTWIFRILVNRAKTRGARERRTVASSSFAPDGPGGYGDIDAFGRAGARDVVVDGALAADLRARILRAIECLAPRQRCVIALRDMEGRSAIEVCALLQISEANQRVLLHRARAAIRVALADYLLPVG
jgi:RNA polymerase sigma-70 factor (ECF subfamily)